MVSLRDFFARALVLMLCGASGAHGESTNAGTAARSGCPGFDAPIARGRIASKEIHEASGIAASHRNPGVYYVHNDSGDTARFYAIDETGRDLVRYFVEGVVAIDWEDIAVGPAANETGSFIYIGDIGDNHHDRATIHVVRVPEPAIALEGEGGELTLSGAVVLSMKYPNGNSYNSEALLLDARTKDLFVVTKSPRGEARIFRYSAPHNPAEIVELEEVGNLQIGTDQTAGANSVTGGDVSSVRNQIVLRTYSQVLVWRHEPGQSIAQALSRPACFTSDHAEPQGEAVGWTPDGSAFVTVSEGSKQPIYFSASR